MGKDEEVGRDGGRSCGWNWRAQSERQERRRGRLVFLLVLILVWFILTAPSGTSPPISALVFVIIAFGLTSHPALWHAGTSRGETTNGDQSKDIGRLVSLILGLPASRIWHLWVGCSFIINKYASSVEWNASGKFCTSKYQSRNK